MDTNNVYKLAVQAQLSAALRELMRLEREEDVAVHAIHIEISRNEDIDVQVFNSFRDVEGYSL